MNTLRQQLMSLWVAILIVQLGAAVMMPLA